MNEWISVKERLPEIDGIYLCVLDVKSIVGFDYNTIETLRYSFGCWLYDRKETNLVTHWMPLPKLPAHDREPPVSDDMRDHLRAYIAGAEDY